MEPVNGNVLDYPQKLDYLVWSRKETTFVNRLKKRRTNTPILKCPLSMAVLKKFKKSVFGTFLNTFNAQQNQTQFLNENKLQIFKWLLKGYSSIDLLSLQKRNNFTDEVLGLLEDAVKTKSPIECQYFFDHLLSLKIVDSNVSDINRFLRKFKFLQVLILCCNWISTFPGKFLPRNLKFLELNTNGINNLRDLCVNSPRQILYVGLGRNQLGVDCELKELELCGCFEKLQILDLSNNDIYELIPTLDVLKGLSISGLFLEGNPCWTCMEYKNAVTKYLPKLEVLDGIRLIESDKCTHQHINNAATNETCFIFCCHRMMGLPAPPKEKGVNHTFHLEVTLPLLDINYQFFTTTDLKTNSVDIGTKNTTSKKGASNKKSKASKLIWPYTEPHQSHENQNCFKTGRLQWAKMMDFSTQIIEIYPPHMDLNAVRDTFKSRVNVKVVYLKSAFPQKTKSKTKKNKKGEAKVTTESDEKPEEIILQRVTVASFSCELYNVPWSERTIDFYWALHPDTHVFALPVEGRLNKLNYVDKKGGFTPSETPYPTIFTCQVGFGLKRNPTHHTIVEHQFY